MIFLKEVGSYARGFVRKISHVTNLRMVEVLAARDDVCWQQIILEYDALHVVQAVGSLHGGSSAIGLLIDDIKTSLRGFLALRICHVHRSVNVVAHKIGKLASIFNLASCWFEPPKLIQDVHLGNSVLS